jgi:hypothetical protein
VAQKVRVINGAAIIRGRGTRVWVRCEVSSDCGWESDDARPRTMNPQEYEHDPEVRPILGKHQEHRMKAH